MQDVGRNEDLLNNITVSGPVNSILYVRVKNIGHLSLNQEHTMAPNVRLKSLVRQFRTLLLTGENSKRRN